MATESASASSKTRHCDTCARELELVYPDGSLEARVYQYADAAWVEVHGGYGMAVDNIERQLAGEPDVRVLLCASCLGSAMSHLGLLDRLHE